MVSPRSMRPQAVYHRGRGRWTWFPLGPRAHRRSATGAGGDGLGFPSARAPTGGLAPGPGQPHVSLCSFCLESSGAPAPEGLPHTLGSRGSVLCHPGHAPVRPPLWQAPACCPLCMLVVLTGSSSALRPGAPRGPLSAGALVTHCDGGPVALVEGPWPGPQRPVLPTSPAAWWRGRACGGAGWPATDPELVAHGPVLSSWLRLCLGPLSSFLFQCVKHSKDQLFQRVREQGEEIMAFV